MIEIIDLKKYFASKGDFFSILSKNERLLRAVDGVNFYVDTGEIFGLVGESGCGKTTLGKTIIGLYNPTSGSILYNGVDIIKEKFTGPARKEVQMIFQDPLSTLNPMKTIRSIMALALDVHFSLSRKQKNQRIDHLLNIVGINPNYGNRFPHEFSGGQRQRIGIARALAAEPKFIIADEPVSKLDVSIQAQIINLLVDLKEELKLSFLFISHDLRIVRYISDRIAVMYLGNIVETAEKKELFNNPLHPYTQALLSAAPDLHCKKRIQEKKILAGEPPSPLNLPKGCKFHPRCPKCMSRCKEQIPMLKMYPHAHAAACHLYG